MWLRGDAQGQGAQVQTWASQACVSRGSTCSGVLVWPGPMNIQWKGGRAAGGSLSKKSWAQGGTRTSPTSSGSSRSNHHPRRYGDSALRQRCLKLHSAACARAWYSAKALQSAACRRVTCDARRPPARDVLPETTRALGATRVSNLHLMLSILRREIIWPAAARERHRGAPHWHSGGARPRRTGSPIARAATHDKRETLLHQIGSCMRQNN